MGKTAFRFNHCLFGLEQLLGELLWVSWKEGLRGGFKAAMTEPWYRDMLVSKLITRNDEKLNDAIDKLLGSLYIKGDQTTGVKKGFLVERLVFFNRLFHHLSSSKKSTSFSKRLISFRVFFCNNVDDDILAFTKLSETSSQITWLFPSTSAGPDLLEFVRYGKGKMSSVSSFGMKSYSSVKNPVLEKNEWTSDLFNSYVKKEKEKGSKKEDSKKKQKLSQQDLGKKKEKFTEQEKKLFEARKLLLREAKRAEEVKNISIYFFGNINDKQGSNSYEISDLSKKERSKGVTNLSHKLNGCEWESLKEMDITKELEKPEQQGTEIRDH